MTRSLVFIVGLLFCVAIWVLVPYNNFAMNNSFISDGYLPEIVLFFLACLIMVANPLLRRFAPSIQLNHKHLVLLVGMMLFAAVIPSNGLYRFFPHAVAMNTRQINESPILSEAIRDSSLAPALFPDEIGDQAPAPAANQLIDELEPGNSIPWSSWTRPMLAWGTVIVAFWLVMIGLGAIVYPQWRNNEHVTFPLLKVYHCIVDEPEEGRLMPPVFRNKLFWIGCGVVILLHSSNGLSLMTGNAFPAFPLSWNISSAFGSGIWQYAPGFLKQSRLYFLFVGLAYFMPNRYSFSIWFTVLAIGLFIMGTREYMPTFNTMSVYDVGAGALIAIALGIIWLGREHYIKVLRASFRRSNPDDHDKTNALAGRIFMVGCLIMFGWFIWAGTNPLWSFLFVALGVVVMLLVARIVADTGLTYIWIIPLTASRFLSLVPRSWISVSTAYLQEAHYLLVNRTSAVSATVMMILTLGLNRKYEPRSSRNFMKIGLIVLVLGFIVCGIVHLHMGYNLASSYDGGQWPITGRGASMISLQAVTDVATGREASVPRDQLNYMIFGFALAVGLLLLCLRFPGWPLHPIGLIFAHSSIGLRLCISMALGWMLRTLILHYFGTRAYQIAMPLFLGLILGEMFANVIWILIPVLAVLSGTAPGAIERLVIFQYT